MACTILFVFVTPSDICHCHQGIEDTNNFLFSCATYINQRAALVISVNEVLRKKQFKSTWEPSAIVFIWLRIYTFYG